MFYLTTHSTHFIYGYMASDIWLRIILIVRKETRCRHIGYSFRLTAWVLLYAPSHRQDSTYHGHCYTSREALAGTILEKSQNIEGLHVSFKHTQKPPQINKANKQNKQTSTTKNTPNKETKYKTKQTSSNNTITQTNKNKQKRQIKQIKSNKQTQNENKHKQTKHKISSSRLLVNQ